MTKNLIQFRKIRNYMLYFWIINITQNILHFLSFSIQLFHPLVFLMILINENNFQVWAYCNRLVRPPHQVISNNGSIIYYTMNQKSIDVTSVIIWGLESMINLCSVEQLTNSVCFNNWSIKKWTQIIRRKIAHAKCLLYSHVKST